MLCALWLALCSVLCLSQYSAFSLCPSLPDAVLSFVYSPVRYLRAMNIPVDMDPDLFQNGLEKVAPAGGWFKQLARVSDDWPHIASLLLIFPCARPLAFIRHSARIAHVAALGDAVSLCTQNPFIYPS